MPNHIIRHTVTSVSIAFRRAMLCTKSELRFRQYSFNHRTRNLRSVEVLRLTSYPLYQHAIVPFEFPRQVGWLFPLFTFNNVPLRGRYTFALSSARSAAYCPRCCPPACCVPARHALPATLPSPFDTRTASGRCCGSVPPAQAGSAYPPFGCPPHF